MTKKLNSGIEVDSEQFYKLLEWKDNNMNEFIEWVNKQFYAQYSITDYTQKRYNELVKFSKLEVIKPLPSYNEEERECI